MSTLQRISRQTRTRSHFHKKRQSKPMHLTKCLWIGNWSARPHNCQVQNYAEVGVLTRKTTLCGPLQQEKSNHKVFQNRQWPTSTPKLFRLHRFRTRIDWNCINRSSEQIWSSCYFEEFLGALPIKPIYHTQRLNPATCCYKTHTLLIFPTTSKGKRN